MHANTLRKFLDENHIKYVNIRHSPAYTAQEIAASAHIPGKELAKTVMVKVDDELAMVVLPASKRVWTEEVSHAANGATVTLAEETEFKKRFPDCERGAMPPFGNLYGMRTYLSPALAKDEEIAFNAGSHTELIRMKYEDFERLTAPVTIKLMEERRTA
jgi:Ala-tRNA(Pro) deacylase